MIDPVRELKIRAEILQHRIASRQPAALARLRRLPEFRAYSDDELEAAAAHVLRRHCLTLLATELGFQGWPSAKAALFRDQPRRGLRHGSLSQAVRRALESLVPSL